MFDSTYLTVGHGVLDALGDGVVLNSGHCVLCGLCCCCEGVRGVGDGVRAADKTVMHGVRLRLGKVREAFVTYLTVQDAVSVLGSL